MIPHPTPGMTLATHSPGPRRIALLAAAALLALAPALGHAASHRLSEGLPFSDVGAFELSPDGRFVVYRHDAVVDNAREVWSVPVVGGDPVRLSGLLAADSALAEFAIAPDSQTVVYSAPQDAVFTRELYSTPIAGPEGSWTRLNPALVTGGSVRFFEIAPGSDRVVFVADVQTDGIDDVWSVPIGGGTAIRLRPAITLVGSGVSVSPAPPRISPDGQRVVFRANFSDLATLELWSARLDGTGSVVKLNAPLAVGGDLTSFAISPDGSRVVYIADQAIDGSFTLYSVPITGGTPTRLSAAVIPSGGDVLEFAVSPDGSRVVYRADHSVDTRDELYSVPLAGGTPTKLNGVIVPADGDVGSFGISPDSSRVVYRADQQANDVFEIYSAPLSGGGAVRLNGVMSPDGDVESSRISPDSTRVVYLADQQTAHTHELYSVPLAGGVAVRVSDPLVPGGNVADYAITPDSDFVVYRADRDAADRYELFRGSILGGAGGDVRLNGDQAPGGGVLWFLLHPDGHQVIFVAAQEEALRFDLYVGDPCILCDGFEAGDLRRWP